MWVQGVVLSSPTPIYCDNKNAIQIVYNSVFHERSKHIEINCHFIGQYLQLSTITLPFVSSSLQFVHIFIKAHTLGRFQFLFD